MIRSPCVLIWSLTCLLQGCPPGASPQPPSHHVLNSPGPHRLCLRLPALHQCSLSLLPLLLTCCSGSWDKPPTHVDCTHTHAYMFLQHSWISTPFSNPCLPFLSPCLSSLLPPLLVASMTHCLLVLLLRFARAFLNFTLVYVF